MNEKLNKKTVLIQNFLNKLCTVCKWMKNAINKQTNSRLPWAKYG